MTTPHDCREVEEIENGEHFDRRPDVIDQKPEARKTRGTRSYARVKVGQPVPHLIRRPADRGRSEQVGLRCRMDYEDVARASEVQRAVPWEVGQPGGPAVVLAKLGRVRPAPEPEFDAGPARDDPANE